MKWKTFLRKIVTGFEFCQDKMIRFHSPCSASKIWSMWNVSFLRKDIMWHSKDHIFMSSLSSEDGVKHASYQPSISFFTVVLCSKGNGYSLIIFTIDHNIYLRFRGRKHIPEAECFVSCSSHNCLHNHKRIKMKKTSYVLVFMRVSTSMSELSGVMNKIEEHVWLYYLTIRWDG